MSLGSLMLDIESSSLQGEDRDILEHPLVGGVILFTRNFESPQQVKELVSNIHAIRKTPLLVAVDQEGGRVQRFREGFTRLPPAADLGAVYEKDSKLACQLAEQTGWLNAAELRSVGVDLNFAPVLDLDYGVSGVIGDRALHKDPEAVANLAHAFMKGMRDAGMEAVGKHFPGHGAITADSHTSISIDERRFEDILQQDIIPFERMIYYGMAGIMIAHVIYPQCDDLPAGFSPYWLKQVLRDELNFQGAIISDDLSMKGAAVLGDCVDRARATLDAGCDMFLICNDRPSVVKVLDEVKVSVNPASNARLLHLQGTGKFHQSDEIRSSAQWHTAAKAVESYSLKQELDLDL